MRQVIRALAAAAVILITGPLLSPPASAAPSAPTVTVSRLPLAFEPNVGQAPADVRFITHSAGHRVWLAGGEARFVPLGRSSVDTAGAIRIRWAGESAASAVVGENEQRGKAHYYMSADPRAQLTAPMYGRVVYRDVYPGVDLVFHGTQRDAEFDFVVHPGADPRVVRLDVTGADALALEGDDLVIRQGSTQLRLHKPVVHQDTPAGRVAVAGRFTLHGRRVALDIGTYDPSRALVIDPILTYSTYVNGDSDGVAIGVDSALNMVVATFSRVIKLSADGSTLVYSTVVGDIDPHALVVDAAGNAYLT